MAKAAVKKPQIDRFLLILALALTGLGLVLLYDASYATALVKFNDKMYYVKSQIVGAGLGLVAMFVISRLNYQWLKHPVIVLGLMVVSIGLLAAVLIVGVELYGAKRWLNLGISVQPSEIAKFAMVLFLAYYLERNRRHMNRFWVVYGWPIAALGIIAMLIMAQPNLSTTILIGVTTMTMILVGGARVKHWLGVCGAGLAAVVVFIFSAEYRMKRMLAFLHPFNAPSDEGYQLVQSLYAIGAGGWFGMGFGNSRQKFSFLPFAESDFIFAIIAEEFGFIGCIFLLSLFALLIWRGIRIALAATDHFGALLACGLTALIGFQVIINVAVVTGTMPPTGLPLPFISQGGSSLTIVLAEIGVLLAISRKMKRAD